MRLIDVDQAKEQIKQMQTLKAVIEREEETVRRVEALAPPVRVEQPEIVKCTFTVRATMDQLKKLKEFLNKEGIQYE